MDVAFSEMTDQDPTRPDVRGAICLVCGYRLDGLRPDGVCPECGTPMEHSLLGLTGSAPEHVAKLRRGAGLVFGALLAYALVMTCVVAWAIFITLWSGGTGPGSPQTSFWWLNALIFAPMLAGLLGWWWLAAPDPDRSRRAIGDAPRQWTRGALIAQVALTVSGFVLPLAFGVAGGGNLAPVVAAVVVGVFNFAAWLVWFFASLLYLQWLAVRLPDERIRRRAKRFMWLGPVLTIVGTICFYIGPIAAFAIYCTLIYAVWRELGKVHERQLGLA